MNEFRDKPAFRSWWGPGEENDFRAKECYKQSNEKKSSTVDGNHLIIKEAPGESWIGFDFDGTLATYGEFGKWEADGWAQPIWPNIERLKRFLDRGIPVRIFTARVAPCSKDPNETKDQIALVEAWCEKYIGQKLPITCQKDIWMLCLYDDRVVQVGFNTGEILGKEFDI